MKPNYETSCEKYAKKAFEVVQREIFLQTKDVKEFQKKMLPHKLVNEKNTPFCAYLFCPCMTYLI